MRGSLLWQGLIQSDKGFDSPRRMEMCVIVRFHFCERFFNCNDSEFNLSDRDLNFSCIGGVRSPCNPFPFNCEARMIENWELVIHKVLRCCLKNQVPQNVTAKTAIRTRQQVNYVVDPHAKRLLIIVGLSSPAGARRSCTTFPETEVKLCPIVL